MKKTFIAIFTLTITTVLFCSFMYWSPGSNKIKTNKPDKQYTKVDGDKTSFGNPPNPEYGYTPMVLEGTKQVGDYVIGPEVATGLDGFYNYQFNGSNGRYIYKNPTTGLLHAIFMLSGDSLNISATRRTGYATSTNDGATWSYLTDVPDGIRSGFCALSWKPTGEAIVTNHMVGTFGGAGISGFLHYDQAPGLGNFLDKEQDHTGGRNFVWPAGTTMDNGNVFVMGTTYQGSAATDTVGFYIFNTTTNTNGPSTFMEWIGDHTQESNQSMSSAFGAGGKGVMVFDTYRETASWPNKPRIFASTTTNNGANWTNPAVIFTPHVIGTDSIQANVNGASDCIMDANGNYYYAFNSNGPTGFFSNARLLVAKNGGEPGIVTGAASSPVNPIPQSVTTMLAQAFMASFDHPSLSISSDGLYLFVSYSVTFQADTCANGYNKTHIFYSFASTANSPLVWSAPIQVTSSGPSSFDERYASLTRVTPKVGTSYNLYMTYQKCAQSGNYCTATPDQPVIRRAFLMFRKISDATTIGISNNSQNVKDFRLNQNYPNPFNPTTLITYNLPSKANVVLKVYDILGSEVATLVNRSESAGSKTVSFDASKYSSGIYFYTIKAGNFSETKKMMLIK